jgi:hypothetical protein
MRYGPKKRRLIGGLVVAAALSASPAWSFEPPIFGLNEAQLKALESYGSAKGAKAFAAGPEGQFAAEVGYASATVAVREALKACDREIADQRKRCIVIDLNGEALPLALQYAQQLRVDDSVASKPLALRDLTFDVDAWRAYQGYMEKDEHKAFALSLKGPWARSWDAASIEEAEKEALEACNRNAPAKQAPCFILARDKELVPSAGLVAKPDLSVDRSAP